MIEKCPKPPKDNEKQKMQIRFNEKGNSACDNGKKSTTIGYTHLWHECLAMTNEKV